MKLYWELFGQWYSNEYILSQFNNPITPYLDIDRGNILDIGCGQSPFILDFVNTEFDLYALDQEKFQLQLLEERVNRLGTSNKIKFIHDVFPSSTLENKKFDIVIISNVLHFYSIQNTIEFLDVVFKLVKSGSLIYLTVHNWKHGSAPNLNYFKHYYKRSDIYNLFPKSSFEYFMFTETYIRKSIYQISFLQNWIRKVCEMENISDENQIQSRIEQYLENAEDESYYEILVKVK